jgi:hypothetical protein
MDVEQTHDRVPTRLDEALRYAVSRIEKDPRNVDVVVRYLGWYGHTPDAKQHPGQPIDVAREAAKQAADRAMEQLRQDGFVPDVVEKSLRLIERSLPLLEMEACEALMKARLCFTRLSCEALLAAGQCFRPEAPFEIASLGSSAALVQPGTATSLTQLTSIAKDLMQSCGCANLMGLLYDAHEILGPSTSERFTEAVIRAGGPFEWLDPGTKWFWYIPEPGSNRLVHQIQRVFAATPRIHLVRLRSAIGRGDAFGSFVPPLKVMESICRRLLFLHIEDGIVIRVSGMAPWDTILTSNEKILTEVLRSHGPLLEREKLLEHCRERGMDEGTFKQLTARSLLFQTNNAGLYAIAGTAIPASTIEDNDRTADILTNTGQGFPSEGNVFLVWKLQSAMLQGGVLRVSEPINTFIDGDYDVKIAGRALGILHIRQRACWDIRRLLLAIGGDAGDTLVIIFNLCDYTATGIVGDDDVVTQITSELVQIPPSGAGWFAAKEGESGTVQGTALMPPASSDE